MDDGVEMDSDSGYHERPTDESSIKNSLRILGSAHPNASLNECKGAHGG